MGKKKFNLVTKIMFGLILGVIVGLFFNSSPDFAVNYIKPVGTLFLNLIKMTIVPLVFSSLVVGAASIGDVKKLGRIGGKTMIYFFITTAIAIVIGLVAANIFKPGVGVTLAVDAQVKATEAPSLIQTLLDIVPTNPIDSLAKGNMLQIIFFAIFTGVGATYIGEKGDAYLKFFDSLAEIMYKLTEVIMGLAPYGVFALMVPVVAVNGPDVLLPLLKLIAVCYLGFILHGIIAYSFSVAAFSKISPLEFFKGTSAPTMIAFSTSSSSGTLPVTIKTVREVFGVSEGIASFVLPLGTTINMDGTAIYQGVCAVFIAQAYGMNLTIAQQLTILLTAVLASIGTAGVPGAGFMMLMMVLSSVGLPLEGAALIAGIDRVLDMGRTAINVTGNVAASIVVGASENEISYENASIKKTLTS
ncbi:dicarboxylate/amino acid:cation symporter [Clostridium cochlearium]|uniref:Na+/H+-dicarboxylate symporter n=2 Tax=Clostridium cochlearium TaxID=1494 RepID=A0A239ZJJ0_CLOCO|nr:dicarboxylate/amino acid:cation symporter [Clostridium cochlearium]MBV1818970.1 dicarboxylate/amino acid:cation symporter [Bacteroidales bacterium MSK.15.36]MBU5269630.1 dicarboxylate/amino acid:cation symporter [Clostridium cochlearium]MCG4572497.1 dicarboxylate/amino acid:cation symporter [Clostridium cochlearium]MCG4578789.1 dicarboxylate/amino acid:cation symporter [Clostridium cochlearium]SDK84430.1 Na+/H+-dicarboxylate symporter [Clostridium cochlearium]